MLGKSLRPLHSWFCRPDSWSGNLSFTRSNHCHCLAKKCTFLCSTECTRDGIPGTNGWFIFKTSTCYKTSYPETTTFCVPHILSELIQYIPVYSMPLTSLHMSNFRHQVFLDQGHSWLCVLYSECPEQWKSSQMPPPFRDNWTGHKVPVQKARGTHWLYFLPLICPLKQKPTLMKFN